MKKYGVFYTENIIVKYHKGKHCVFRVTFLLMSIHDKKIQVL